MAQSDEARIRAIGQELLDQVKTMDDKTFSKFAQRLAALKNIKEKGSK